MRTGLFPRIMTQPSSSVAFSSAGEEMRPLSITVQNNVLVPAPRRVLLRTRQEP